MAASIDQSESSSDADSSFAGSLQFAAVFSTLLYFGLTVVGAVILRKYKTPLSIGAFIGFVFVVANLCLILSAMFANVADVMEDDDRDRPYEAFATFQFFLFAVYSTFFVALSVFRNDLIEQVTYGDEVLPTESLPRPDQPHATESPYAEPKSTAYHDSGGGSDLPYDQQPGTVVTASQVDGDGDLTQQPNYS